MTDEQKPEYVPHFQKLEEAKTEVRESVKTIRKRTFNLSEMQIHYAEAMVRLLKHPDFQLCLSLETELQTQAVMSGFQRRSGSSANPQNPVTFAKTFGEDMSYNEGYHHGIFRFKSERDDLVRKYLDWLKEEQETKNEN